MVSDRQNQVHLSVRGLRVTGGTSETVESGQVTDTAVSSFCCVTEETRAEVRLEQGLEQSIHGFIWTRTWRKAGSVKY